MRELTYTSLHIYLRALVSMNQVLQIVEGSTPAIVCHTCTWGLSRGLWHVSMAVWKSLHDFHDHILTVFIIGVAYEISFQKWEKIRNDAFLQLGSSVHGTHLSLALAKCCCAAVGQLHIMILVASRSTD